MKTKSICVINTEILRQAYADSHYGFRLEQAKSTPEIIDILEQFCKEHSYKTKTIKLQ